MKPIKCYFKHNFCDYQGNKFTVCSQCGKELDLTHKDVEDMEPGDMYN